MATHRFTSDELRQLHDVAKQWAKIVSRRAFGDDGPGLDVDLRTFEQLAHAAAHGRTEGTLQLLLEQQAANLPTGQPCPHWGRLCLTRPSTRTLTAQGAAVQQAEPVAHCPACRRDFFPPRPALGLDEHAVSSSVLERVVTAAARFSSFADATAAVRMADIALSESQVRRPAHRVGHELIAERDRRAEEHRHRRPPARTAKTPQAVVVEVDGGRIRTRAANSARGAHDARTKGDKIACLATLSGPTFATDPCPDPPDSFLRPRRVRRLATQMKKAVGEAGPPENAGDSGPPADRASGSAPRERWSPVRVVRTCVASPESSRPFGRLVATGAHGRGFFGAKRRAFVADGAAYNWSIHAGYFREFGPVVDLLHVLCYLYTSAQAVSGDAAAGWGRYTDWVRAVWQGRAGEELTQLDAEQERLGVPPDGATDDRTDPRRVVWEAGSYSRHNRERMDYPRYRREGRPTTSSLAESLVGEFGTRVKGKQKHWTRPAGAESILQLRAAVLSEDGRLERHFAHRPGWAFRKRPRPDSPAPQTAN